MKKIVFIVIVLTIFATCDILDSSDDCYVFNVIYISENGWCALQKTKIQIAENGELNLDLVSCSGEKTSRSRKLSFEEFEEFKRLVFKADVFNLNDEYKHKRNVIPCDIPHEVIKFKIFGLQKTIEMIAPEELPESLDKILTKIVDYINSLMMDASCQFLISGIT